MQLSSLIRWCTLHIAVFYIFQTSYCANGQANTTLNATHPVQQNISIPRKHQHVARRPQSAQQQQLTCANQECVFRAWLPECRHCPAIVKRFASAHNLTLEQTAAQLLITRVAILHDQRHQSLANAIDAVALRYDVMLLAVLQSDGIAAWLPCTVSEQIRRLFKTSARLPTTRYVLQPADDAGSNRTNVDVDDNNRTDDGLRAMELLLLEFKQIKLRTSKWFSLIEEARYTCDQARHELYDIIQVTTRLNEGIGMSKQPYLQQLRLDNAIIKSALDDALKLYIKSCLTGSSIQSNTNNLRRSKSSKLVKADNNDNVCIRKEQFMSRMPSLVIPMPAVKLWQILTTSANATEPKNKTTSSSGNRLEGTINKQTNVSQVSVGYPKLALFPSVLIPKFETNNPLADIYRRSQDKYDEEYSNDDDYYDEDDLYSYYDAFLNDSKPLDSTQSSAILYDRNALKVRNQLQKIFQTPDANSTNLYDVNSMEIAKVAKDMEKRVKSMLKLLGSE